MAGYSTIYCVGGRGGFMGADGANPINLQIWVGDADRQWFEPYYFTRGLRPFGKVKVLIPPGPDARKHVGLAILLFCSNYFQKCRFYRPLMEEMAKATKVDFDLGENVPANITAILEEARSIILSLNVWEARMKEVSLE